MSSDFPTPFSGSNRMKLSNKEYRNGIFGVILFLLVIFSYAFEFKHFSNTFGIEKMVVRAFVIAAIAGAVIAFFYSKRYFEPLDKFKTYVFFIIIFLMIAPLLASLTNRYLSFSEIKQVEVIFEKQEAYIKSRFGKVKSKTDGVHLFFLKDQKFERVKTKKLQFPDAEKGDKILIGIKKGFWGYEYFLED